MSGDRVRASEVRRRATTLTWRERIPNGRLCAIGGNESVSKNLLTCLVARDILEASKGTVLISTIEDHREEDLRPRLEAAGVELERVILECAWRRFPDGAERLQADIEAEQTRFAVFDPFVDHMATPSMHAARLREAFAPLAAVAENTRCPIVLINPRWLGSGVTREQVVDGLRPQLALPVEHLLATHGWHLLESGRMAARAVCKRCSG